MPGGCTYCALNSCVTTKHRAVTSAERDCLGKQDAGLLTTSGETGYVWQPVCQSTHDLGVRTGALQCQYLLDSELYTKPGNTGVVHRLMDIFGRFSNAVGRVWV